MTINIKIGQRTEVKILCYLKFKTRKKGKFEIQNSSLEVIVATDCCEETP